MNRSISIGHLGTTVDLARCGAGAVSPNPMVGAVVVRNGEVVATGYHAQYGGPHAEAAALNAAGERAEGSTLYCNLEPCSYTAPDKHQPPCTRRIIEAGVDHVVIGQLDPNPRVRGRGVQQLRDAGITVSFADDDNERSFWRLNDAFNTWMALRRPFIHLKAAITLDGKVADHSGHSRWITDEAARRRAHDYRSVRDGILVGIATVLTDNPSLTTRHVEGRSPLPIVLDSHLRIPLESQLVADRGTELVVFTRKIDATDPREREELAERRRRLEERGVTVRTVPVIGSAGGGTVGGRSGDDDRSWGDRSGDGSGDGGLHLPSVLDELHRMQITSILVEGGAAVLTSFVAQRLFDRISLFIAPIIIGTGRSVFGDIGVSQIANALRLEGVEWEQIGEQQLLNGYHPDWLSNVRTSVGPRELSFDTEEALNVYGNR